VPIHANTLSRRVQAPAGASSRQSAAPSGVERESLGRWLAAAREAAGLSLPELAARLRLQQVYLQALEADDFAKLPARIYVSGYVRAYAAAVGHSPDEALRHLQVTWQNGAGTEIAPALNFPNAPQARRFPAGALSACAVIATLIGYGYWYYSASVRLDQPRLSPVTVLEERSIPDGAATFGAKVRDSSPAPEPPLGPLAPVDLQHLPDGYAQDMLDHGPATIDDGERVPLPEGPFPRPRPNTPLAEAWAAMYGNPTSDPTKLVANESEAGTSADFEDSVGLPAGDGLAAYLPKLHLRADLGPLNLRDRAIVRTRPNPTQVAEAPPRPVDRMVAYAGILPLAAESNANAPPVSFPSSQAPPTRRQLIAAGEAVWVQITGKNGSIMVSRLLGPGETAAVPDGPGLTLTTSNAGSLSLSINGKTQPPMGDRGEIIRNINLPDT